MGADRWSECPKCKQKKVSAVSEVRAAYGRIPLEDFEKLLKAANIARAVPFDTTLREDWELYLEGDGLSLTYVARCDCGFEFKISRKLKPD